MINKESKWNAKASGKSFLHKCEVIDYNWQGFYYSYLNLQLTGKKHNHS